MDSSQLKAIQAPLKEQYRSEPSSARVTLSAEGTATDAVACKIETGKGLVAAGLHPATGGDGSFACSGDMLLEALVACAGVTLRAVATSMGIELRSAHLKAEGDIDFRGTLGVSKEAPVGFQDIRLHFKLDSPAPEAQLEKLIEVTERYCVVLQTLRNPPIIRTDVVKKG